MVQEESRGDKRERKAVAEEVALVIAHTCKFRPARIPMREAGLYRIRSHRLPGPISVERREEGCR